MAGKYLDLEVKWLREDLERETEWLREDIEYLRKDIESLWGSIEQIQDLVGIERKERKDSFTIEELVWRHIGVAEALLKRYKKSGEDSRVTEELEKEIKKYKEQNKLH